MSPRKKKMKLYTVRVKMDDLCCPVWREVTIPSILVLHDVYRIILEAFGWDDESCYLFQFKKCSYIGDLLEKNSLDAIDWNLSLDSKPVGNETLEEAIGNSKAFNLLFVSNDLWVCHATVLKKESVDMDLFPFECLAGEGACPSSLFESESFFNEAYMIMTDSDSDPDAKEEVDAFLKDNDLYVNGQWPGEFDLDAANKRLDDLKERMKEELKEYFANPVEPFVGDPNDEIPSNWISDWMEDDANGSSDANIETDIDVSNLSDSLFNSFVELFKINNIPCDGIDFNKKDISQFDFDALLKKLEKSSDPQMRFMLGNLKSVLLTYNFINMMEDSPENNISDKNNNSTQKKTKSKKTSSSKKPKKKKSDDKDDKE